MAHILFFVNKEKDQKKNFLPQNCVLRGSIYELDDWLADNGQLRFYSCDCESASGSGEKKPRVADTPFCQLVLRRAVNGMCA